MIGTRPAQTAVGAKTAIRLDGVSVSLSGHLALRDISVSIASGAFVGLLGPNGSGKSTLLRTVLGVLPVTAGTVQVEGTAPDQARDLFSYLPQRRNVDLDAPLRVWDVVMMGRIRKTGWLRPAAKDDREVVAWALGQVGMIDRRNTAIGELSFGQQQRVFLARALAQEGRIVLLDEPMNGVDTGTQELFVGLLSAFHRQGKTIVMATHDLNMAADVCDNLLLINQRLIAYGPVEVTFQPERLRETFGAHLHFLEMPAPAGRDHPEVIGDHAHHDMDEVAGDG
jgi:ABC-type Mn2+/Zn2+ transport system ATPase subunit